MCKVEGKYILLLHLSFPDPPDGSDFKLDEFHASDCETFEPYYGERQCWKNSRQLCYDRLISCTGCHGDGDITNTENLTSLQEHVFEATNGLGVHFVMGDGVCLIYVRHSIISSPP